MTAVFIERESLELKQVQAFLERESPACEVVMACGVEQAFSLAQRRGGRPRVLVVQGGLADGRAHALVERFQAAELRFERVAFVDRRAHRGALDEFEPDALADLLRPSLAEGWLLVRFSAQPA